MAFSKRLLQALSQFSPLFRNLFAWGRGSGKEVFFAEDFSDFEGKLLPLIHDKKRCYENPDPTNKGFTLDSIGFAGFRASYSNTDADNFTLTLSIAAGAPEFHSSVVNIEFFKETNPSFYDYAFTSALMKLLINYCEPHYAFVISHPFWNAVEIEDEDGLNIRPIGWLTYLADPRTAQLLPTDVEQEVLPTGGTLITLQHEFPSADNPDDVAAAIRIRDVLLDAGLLRL